MWAALVSAFRETAQAEKVHFYVRDRHGLFWGKTGAWVKRQDHALVVSGRSESAVWDYVDAEIDDDESIWLQPKT